MARPTDERWQNIRVPVQLHGQLLEIARQALASEKHPLRDGWMNDRSELPLWAVVQYLVNHLHNDRRRGRKSSKNRSAKHAALRSLLACGLSAPDGE